MFHLITKTRSTTDANDRIIIEKMSELRNFHELKKFWYMITAQKCIIEPTIPVAVMKKV
jgi:hypothetical protein